MHKVGKQWKTISIAMLMTIGGIAAATHVASADTTDTQNNQTQAQSATNHQINQSSPLTQVDQNQSSSVDTTQQINEQANSLHASILGNNLNSESTSEVGTTQDVKNTMPDIDENQLSGNESDPQDTITVNVNDLENNVSTSNYSTGTYQGLNYIKHGNGNIEFTSGTMNNSTHIGAAGCLG